MGILEGSRAETASAVGSRVEHMPRAINTLRLCAAGLAALAMPARLAAQDIVLELPLPTPPKAVAVQVPGGGVPIPLTLVKTGTAATSVKLVVTPFGSDTGEQLVPRLSSSNAAESGNELTLDAKDRQFLTATLVVPALPTPGPFRGNVFVVLDNGTPLQQVVTITAASPPRPAALEVQPETDSRVHIVRTPFWFSEYSPPKELDLSLGPTFDIRVSDAAGRWPVSGLGLGPAGVAKAPGSFNFTDHAALYGEDDQLLQHPIPVPASGRTVRLQLGGLTAGEYNITVPFLAANATGERKLVLIVFSKHHVGYAVLCLVVALITSYLASKLVSIRTERVRLTDRINELRPAWLQKEPQSLAVAWIQSIESQARRLAETWTLPSPETIHKRLDRAHGLLRSLDRLRRMRREIRESELPRLATARALKVAERLSGRLDPEMSDAELAEFDTAITDLRGWTQGQGQARYSADLSAAIARLLTEITPDAIAVEGHRQRIVELVNELKTALPTSTAELEVRERRYAMLKILWERRGAPEFANLLPLVARGIDPMFQVADEAAWARVEARRDQLAVVLASHKNGLSPEAFDPLTFRLTTGDPSLDATFLVMHGLTYEWNFELTGKKRKRAPLRSSTSTPYVPIFAPFAGAMSPSVKLVHARGWLSASGKAVTVTRSRRFAVSNSVSTGELLQLGLAFVVAVMTGLQTFYYRTASFGSLADYMGLFAWGATIDQVKNFLQRLPASPSTTAVASLPVPAVLTPSPTSTPAATTTPAAQVPFMVPPTGPGAAAGAGTASASAAPAVGNPAPPAAPPTIPDPVRPSSLPIPKRQG